jgi:hypothetical protein
MFWFSDVNSCKKRKSLRDGFVKHYRFLKTCPIGSAGGKKKSWPFYNQLEFLVSHVEFKESTGDYTSESPVESQEQDQDEISQELQEQSPHIKAATRTTRGQYVTTVVGAI